MITNILAIGAHPDDIEFGLGGTVAKLAENGHSVFFLIMTFGGNPIDNEVRKKEAMVAGEFLGVEKIIFGGVDPFKLAHDRKNIKIIESVIEEFKPDEIYLPHISDTHQDHRNVTLCALSATRRFSKTIYFYETPSTLEGFIPQRFVDIGKHVSTKKIALNAHASQHTKYFLYLMDAMEGLAITRGMQSRNSIKYAEAFQIFRDVEK